MVPPQPQSQALRAQRETRFSVTMTFKSKSARGRPRQKVTHVTVSYMDPEDRHKDKREEMFRNCEEKLHERALGGMRGLSVRADYYQLDNDNQPEAPRYYSHGQTNSSNQGTALLGFFSAKIITESCLES